MPAMDFKQISTILNAVVEQATGRESIAPATTSEFVTSATTALEVGYDQLNTAISRVLARTIFSNRPYTRKFKGLQKSEQQWGNHVRKINFEDTGVIDNSAYALSDGSAIDMYQVHKPQVLQTNFYGGDTFSRAVTIYDYQINDAFTGPEQFGGFISGVMQNIDNQMEQDLETLARGSVVNFVAGKIIGAGLSSAISPESVVHLVTVYNDQTGKTLTSETVRQPENYTDFTRWAFGYIQSIADKMTERTALYHTTPSGHTISRFTPKNRMKAYLLAPEVNQIESRVLNTFTESFLKFVDFEPVNFWQAIDTPSGINVDTANYMGLDGTIKTGSAVQSNIYGVIFDEEAIGYTLFNKKMYATPMNARGAYVNYWWHYTARYWNDFTENGVVLLLD